MPVYTIQGPDGKTYDVEGPGEPSGTNYAREAAAVADQTVRGGVMALPNLVRHGGNWLESKFPTPDWAKFQIPEGVVKAYDTLTTPMKPETEVGKALGNVGEAAVGTLVGPGMLTSPGKLLAIGAGAGAGGETAARLLEDNLLTRLGGGLVGGGAVALKTVLRPNDKEMTKRAIKGMTEDDWVNAYRAEATLNAADMPHIKSQLLGPNSSLADIVQQASANPEVRPGLLKATRGVAEKAGQAVNSWRQANTPILTDERRALQQDIQNTAKQADWGVLNRANAEYEAVMPKSGTYGTGYIENLRKDILTLANSEKFGPTSEGGKALIAFAEGKLPKAVPGTPAQTLPGKPTGMLDAQGRPILGQPTIVPAKPGVSGEMEMLHLNNLVKDLNTMRLQDGWKGLPGKELKDLLKSYTPEFDAARAAKRAVMETEATPMRQGLAGTITRMGGGPNENKYTATSDMVNLVFPADKAQPLAIKQLSQNIGPEAVGQLLNEHLNTSFQRAAKAVGENPKAPVNFVEAVFGTPAQRENIEAAIEASSAALGTNPKAAKAGFLELMHAMGTYKDLKLSPGVSGASTGFEAGKSGAGAIAAPNSTLRRFFSETASAKTYQNIADMVTSPDGLKQLERIARMPDFRAKSAFIRSVLTAANEDNSPELQ